MTKLLLFTLTASILFINADCKSDPVTPDNKPDTTSHNFTWQTFTWGGGGASSINDVAMINDVDIWVAGEILLPDSVAQDTLGRNPPFGAAHWNGKEWNFFRLPAIVSPTYTEYLPTTGIIAFSSTDIWFASGGGVHRFNGKTITQSYWLKKFPGNIGILDEGQTVEKLWGSSSSDLYAVGRNGGIARFNGSSWQKIESGTTLNLHDIYGATDSKTGEQQILAVGSSNIPFNRVILRIQGTSVTTLSSSPIEYELIGVWFVPNQHYYVVGDGVFEKTSLNESTWKNNPLDITSFGMSAVRGNGVNDIFSVGSFMEIVHYNGSTWYNYSKEIPHSDGALGALNMKGNTVIAGGQTGQDAIILMGKR